MTTDERFAYLNTECKAMIEVAALSSAFVEVLVKCLDHDTDEIAKVQLLPSSNARSTAVLNPAIPTPLADLKQKA